MSILAVVGDGMAGSYGVAAKVFNSLGAATQRAGDCPGRFRTQYLGRVESKVSAKALRAVHAAFYLSPNTSPSA